MARQWRNISHIVIISVFFAYFQCVVTTPFRETEFTPEQKKRIAEYQLIQKQLEKKLEDLDAWLTANTGSYDVPSAAVVIISEGEFLFKKVFRNSDDHLYEMASITKTFIALAILQLIERGLLSFQDPVSRFLPVHLENPDISSPPITIWHLLTHTSGLVDGEGYIDKNIHPRLAIPEQKYPAGQLFHYSNQAYNMLGLVIPVVSGMPLHEYVRKSIVVPLQMNDTETPEDMAGSAGIKCSVDDLGNYMIMFLNKGSFKGKRILSEKMFTQIFRETYMEPPSKYREYRGIAFRIWTIDNKIYSFHHAAHMYGAGGFMQLFPRHRAGYLFICNPPVYETDAFYRFYGSLKYKLMDISGLLVYDEINPADFKITLPDKDEMRSFAGRYVNRIDKSFVDVWHEGGDYLTAMKSTTNMRYIILPTSKHTFVYIYPGQSEKGEIYDFIWEKGKIVALGVKDGYYHRADDAGRKQ